MKGLTTSLINTTYYDGFEGEPELLIRDENREMIIWNGYFVIILNSILKTEVEKGGMPEVYSKQEGWYDEPWPIEDIPLTINQLRAFDLDKTEGTETLMEVLPELIEFLENAEGQVFIEYE
ncbi:hypothetical protein AV656_08065 [Bhargavaea cecembensis]|uniref:Uncharacterized protein n=1 Tax=Bhargavaea cecembensis TaxID=394098 RepID=A0A163FK85_9BACL|nr:hypothetical protein AV656_08065 [Bhargavaea cecembensis]